MPPATVLESANAVSLDKGAYVAHLLLFLCATIVMVERLLRTALLLLAQCVTVTWLPGGGLSGASTALRIYSFVNPEVRLHFVQQRAWETTSPPLHWNFWSETTKSIDNRLET
jgi:hypothetical protein